MLLAAGTDPTIFNAQQETPVDTLRRLHFDNHTDIPLFERAQFMVLLAKPRAINDANHAIVKAKEEAERKVSAAAPTWLKERLREQQQQQQQQHLLLGPPLPRVELHSPPASDGDNENKKAAEKFHAVLQYILHAEEVGETGEMKAELFVDLMEMMAPRWDPIRRSAGGGGGGGGGQGQGKMCFVFGLFMRTFGSFDTVCGLHVKKMRGRLEHEMKKKETTEIRVSLVLTSQFMFLAFHIVLSSFFLFLFVSFCRYISHSHSQDSVCG